MSTDGREDMIARIMDAIHAAHPDGSKVIVRQTTDDFYTNRYTVSVGEAARRFSADDMYEMKPIADFVLACLGMQRSASDEPTP